MWYSILFWSCFITIFSERELLCLWGHAIVKMFNKHFLLMLGTLCVYIGIFTLFYFEQMPFVKFLIFFPAISYLSISLILMNISIYICSVCVYQHYIYVYFWVLCHYIWILLSISCFFTFLIIPVQRRNIIFYFHVFNL